MIEPVLGTRCLHRHVTTIVGIDRRVKLTDEAANSAKRYRDQRFRAIRTGKRSHVRKYPAITPRVSPLICWKIQNSFTSRPAIGNEELVVPAADTWRNFRLNSARRSIVRAQVDLRLQHLNAALCSPEAVKYQLWQTAGLPLRRIAPKTLVPVERIELPTFGLQNRCSTAELNRRIERVARCGPCRPIVRRVEYQTCPQRASI
jgi:hypothetical protein